MAGSSDISIQRRSFAFGVTPTDPQPFPNHSADFETRVTVRSRTFRQLAYFFVFFVFFVAFVAFVAFRGSAVSLLEPSSKHFPQVPE